MNFPCSSTFQFDFVTLKNRLDRKLEFEGGDLEVMAPGKFANLKQGHAICFASFLNHRVNPVKRGMRQSLVVWFGGKPFR